MIGAIIGDIVGSRFERFNHKSTDFELFADGCHFTDDTVMTVSVADAILKSRHNLAELGANTVKSMQTIGRRYPNCGYGQKFYLWLHRKNPKPYQSFGNGAAMRISPVAYAANSIEECIELSRVITSVSHDHSEGIKGAEATAVATWVALHGKSKLEVQEMIEANYYPLDFTLDDIRPSYRFDVSCQGSVPQAIKAFLESYSFEEAIRLAVSIGGDSDTIAAIAGGIAGAYYGVPDDLITQVMRNYLPDDLRSIVGDFSNYIVFKNQ